MPMKFPVTPLLYLVSLGSLGGIVHAVYKFSDKEKQKVPSSAELAKKHSKLKKKGEGLLSSQERWDRSEEKLWFWKQLTAANFTGKVPKKPLEDGGNKPPPVVEKPKHEIIQVADILEVICIMRAGEDTGVVVRYDTDVEVPAGEIVSAAVSSPLGSTIPKGRRNGRNNRRAPRPAPVRSGAASRPPDHLRLGEKLWKPYDYIVLQAVADDASHCVFELQIEEKKDKNGKFPRQRVIRGSLDLDPKVMHDLILMRGGKLIEAKPGAGGNTKSSAPADIWEPVKETRVSSTGKVRVSAKDQQWLERNGQDIFTQDVRMGDYSGGTGKNRVRGVQIRKITPRMQRFGINSGDVIISLNGVPVTGMASAKKVGRRLYETKGVRNFRAQVLREGQIIERTYSFKK